MSSTVNEKEIQQFSKDSSHWWDLDGPFAPLHRMTPARMSYIKTQICAHTGRDIEDLKSLGGLKILDIGCGGGLICEPLCRLGADVTGLDADANAIEVAKNHAAAQELQINYLCGSIENHLIENHLVSLRRKPESGNSQEPDSGFRRNDSNGYDIVLALEILEHVDNIEDFIGHCARVLNPGGLVIFSTLNRTAKSYALGIIAAEYILRWVPAGTHDWKKFIKPSELSRMVRLSRLEPSNISGLILNPLKNDFEISKTDIDVNYFLSCKKD